MGDATGRRRTFGYGAITLCGREFNPVRLERRFITPAGPVGARTRDPATPHAQPPTGITRTRFGLIRFRSPLLTEYPFLQVLRCFTSLRTPRPRRCRPMTAGGFPHSEILGSKPCWRLPEAYRSLTRPSSVLSAKASTIRPSRATTRPPATKPANTGQQIFALMITKRSEQRTKPLQEEVRPKNSKQEKNLSCSRPLSSSQTTTTTGTRTREPHQGDGRDPVWRTDAGPEGPVAVREPKSMPIPHESHRSLPHQQPHRRRTIRPGGDTGREPRPESP